VLLESANDAGNHERGHGLRISSDFQCFLVFELRDRWKYMWAIPKCRLIGRSHNIVHKTVRYHWQLQILYCFRPVCVNCQCLAGEWEVFGREQCVGVHQQGGGTYQRGGWTC